MSKIDYSKIISRSWEITKKNKWLWVPAMVLAAYNGFSGGGGSSNVSNDIVNPSSSPTPIQEMQKDPTKVLGIVANNVSNWFENISTINWSILVLLIILVAIVGLISFLILKNWARGSLIAGLSDANNNQEISLSSISKHGMKNVKNLLIFDVINFVIGISTVLGFVLIFVIGGILQSILGPLVSVIFVLIGIVAIIGFIYLLIIFSMINMYAERLIVNNQTSPWEAWKKGFNLSTNNFFSTLWMGIINNVLGILIGILMLIVIGVFFGLPIYYIVSPLFLGNLRIPTFLEILIVVVLVILLFTISFVTNSVFTVFKYCNWNLFYNEILEGPKTDE